MPFPKDDTSAVYRHNSNAGCLMSFESIAQCFAAIDRELWIVTAASDGQLSGLVATTVMQASIVQTMPRVLVTISRQHRTWKQIESSSCFALHLVYDDQLDLIWRFGLQSGRDAEKFNDIPYSCGTTGSPILSDTPAWFECRVENRMETGDRTVYLAEIIRGKCDLKEKPLTVQKMLANASADKLQRLKSLRESDAKSDADAITAWRKD